MSLTSLVNSLKARLNGANPNEFSAALQAIKFGDVLRALPVQLRSQAPATNSYNLATVQCISLPDDAKAAFILAAYAYAGTGTTGFLVADPPSTSPGTAPAATHCQVTPNGDIGFLGTDAYTKVDVLYVPARMDVIELVLPCATSVATLPSSLLQSPVTLLEAEALAGTVTGKKIVLTPGSGPAAGQARLNVAMSSVTFNNGTDAVTQCRVKLGVKCATDINALLEAASSVL